MTEYGLAVPTKLLFTDTVMDMDSKFHPISCRRMGTEHVFVFESQKMRDQAKEFLKAAGTLFAVHNLQR